MYTLHKLITWFMILISPVRMIAALPIIIPANVSAQSAQTPAPYHLTLDTTSPQAITVHVPARPNFDTDVLAPLRADQAAEAAAAEAQAQAAARAAMAAMAAEKARAATVVTATPAVSAPAGDDAYRQLSYCEAGGDYTRNSGNGYFGAYQYSLSTWNNYDGYARPDLAPASVQDARVHADVARRGWSAWPACSRKLGLM